MKVNLIDITKNGNQFGLFYNEAEVHYATHSFTIGFPTGNLCSVELSAQPGAGSNWRNRPSADRHWCSHPGNGTIY
jgi:hypothetical protein